MKINKLIKNKDTAISHSKEDIKYIVDSYTAGNISDSQMTKWLKAVYSKGMDFQETINYTNTVVNSGKKLSLKIKKDFLLINILLEE